MTIVQRKQEVCYSPAEMYQLVDDVQNYQDFLPWCKKSSVLSRTENEVRATLLLSAGGMYKSFTTCNRLQKDKMIQISLVDGPFKHLEGFWLFHPSETNTNINTKQGCCIQFELEFEFSTRLLSMAFSPVFNQVANTLVDAFVKRADCLYGFNGKEE